MPDPKQASAGGVLYIPQQAWDTDPVAPAPVQVPLSGEANFGADQDPMQAEIYMEDGKGGGMVPGRINARGTIPFGMEFVWIGYALRDLLTTYTHVAGTGLHRFIPGAAKDRRLWQAQKNLRGGTDLFARLINCLTSSLNWTLPDEGAVTGSLAFTGNGAEMLTGIGGVVENNSYAPMSAFYGKVLKDGVDVTSDLTKLSLDIGCTVNEQRGPLGDGKAKALAAGPINFKGDLGLLVRDDLNFYNAAINATLARLEIILSNAPTDYADYWLRVFVSRGRFSRKGPRVGSVAGVKIEQAWQADREQSATSDGWEGEVYGTKRGPYAITAGVNDKALVTMDGSDYGPVTIPPGAAVTAAQVAAAIQAFAGFSTKGIADAFMGRVRIRSKTYGASSSAAFKATATDCYTALGVNTTASTGQAGNMAKVELQSPKTTDYA